MKLRLLSCVIGLGLLSTSAVAQQLTGTMSGTVKDSQGAVVPGVTVTAKSDALIGGPRTVVTNETGTYQFTALPPGTFQLTFGRSRFVTLKREGVAVRCLPQEGASSYACRDPSGERTARVDRRPRRCSDLST
jgi:hypothetical protein